MNKKIVTIAEIAFALVFVLIIAVIFSRVYNVGNTINLDIENMQETINDAGLAPYDDKTVSGDTVMSTINKMETTRNGMAMSYAVCASSGDGAQAVEGNWEFYGHQAIGFTSNQANAEDITLFDSNGNKITGLGSAASQSTYTKYNTNLVPNENGYISPVKTYLSKLVFNKNGVLVGMAFIPET